MGKNQRNNYIKEEFINIQISLDFLSVEEALRVGRIVYEAGADWIEVGTPLITFQGVRSIGAIAKEFPDRTIVADYKALDGVAKYVKETAKQGAHIATVAAVATNASIRQAVKAAKESGVKICGDLYAVHNLVKRAKELEHMGINYLLVHLGADEKSEDPRRDPLKSLPEVASVVGIPVGVVTFTKEEAVEAACQGARFIVVGNPLLSSENLANRVREFIKAVKGATGNHK